MKVLNLGVAVAIGVLAAACASRSPADAADGRETRGSSVTLGEAFRLRFGEQADAGDLTVAFESVEDSRCPTEVECVWEGDGVVGLRVTGSGEAVDVTLHTHPDSAAVARVAGHDIRLVDLDPDPVDGSPIPRSDYVATLRIDRAP